MHETDTEEDQGNSDDDASLFTNRNENLIESEGENEDDWSKDDVEMPSGVSNTFLTASDFWITQILKIF